MQLCARTIFTLLMIDMSILGCLNSKLLEFNIWQANIERALDKLCDHLPRNLINQCESLVEGYSKELVEMLLADLTPQEICVYIKLCDANNDPKPTNLMPVDKDGEICKSFIFFLFINLLLRGAYDSLEFAVTNEIPDYPLIMQKPVQDNKCIVCEFFMQYIDKAMRKKSTKEEIEKIVHSACNYLPKVSSQECNGFVDQYADVLIDLLSSEVSLQEACTMAHFCGKTMQRLQGIYLK